jgi:hypothetical protein
MCGLCGSFTQQGTVLSKRDRTVRARVLEGLLIANQVRGTDSTGVAAINFDKTYMVGKKAVAASRYVGMKEYAELVRKDSPIMIGHTRMTSMGNDVRDENAHPFVEGQIIGAHNGVINNYTQLDKSVRVDSQAVFREIDKADDVETALAKVSGSCALTWYDAREPTALYLVAHSNPLSAAIVPRINTLFWSSVDDHLFTVLHVAYGSAIQPVEIKRDTVYRFDAEDVYKWQEQKVKFADAVSYNRYSGSYSWEDEAWAQNYARGGSGTAGPKLLPGPMSATSRVVPVGRGSEDLEEERYEAYWEERLASQSESAEGFEGSSANEIIARIHDMPEERFQAAMDGLDDSPTRFRIDDIDNTLQCGYCEKGLGEGGAWDDGLQMLICRYCQKWWDEFGHYSAEGQALLARAALGDK